MIDYGAFGYCSSLECIIIPSSVKKIKSFAFNGCDKLIKVVCFAKNPPVLDSYSFEALSSKILYVPNKSLSEYKSTNIWNGFGIIQSADEEINPGTLSSCSTPNLTFFQVIFLSKVQPQVQNTIIPSRIQMWQPINIIQKVKCS